jgi:hypothetical protein
VAVNSGRRCAARNAKAGGSKRSRHLIGCAADIRMAGGRMADVKTQAPRQPEFAALTSRLCRLPGWEFRIYDTFVHVAVPRDESAKLWEGAAVRL